MIIYRYLARQLFWTTLAVTSVLTFVIVSGRFLKYLSKAAVGKLEGGVVLLVILYRMPDYMQMILPLGMFLGILLAYGRMYMENEMVVLQASGMSQWRLVRWTLGPALWMTLLMASFSFYLAPLGVQTANDLVFEQEKRSGLEVLSPRRFHSSSDSRTVTYVEDINSKAGQMENLFIVNYDRESVKEEYRKVVIMRADKGDYRIDSEGNRYLIMSDGVRFEVKPGEAEFQRFEYDEYRIKLQERMVSPKNNDYSSRTTFNLMNENTLEARAELEWRFSLVMLVLIVTLLAVPLSKVNPRQGRYFKLLPAILLYLVYLSALMGAKSAFEKGQIPAAVGFWWVHLIFLGVALLFNQWPQMKLSKAKKGRKPAMESQAS